MRHVLKVAILSAAFLSIAGYAYDAAHPECSFFGPQRKQYVEAAVRGARSHPLSSRTEQALAMLSYRAAAQPTSADTSHPPDSVDAYIFADFQANAITPAPKTTDWEFIRRVTLDLTGRIPAPDRVLTFVADTAPDKRAKLIDELLAKSQWVDKWSMYLGDLYGNNATKPSTNLQRGVPGRNNFAQWIQDALAKNKPYNQMAAELIATPLGSSNDFPTINWLVGGVIANAPLQDTMDQMTANVFETFLGMGHVNCVLCHNGRGHLDSLSLWATNTTRYQAWQLASFVSRDQPHAIGQAFWLMQENGKDYSTDYALNTVSGNRPARQPSAGCTDDACQHVAPQYIFNGDTPKPGENYRAALARNVTGDFQFARASVNYIWAQFFGRGIVDPPDSFDPARLDPDNPPPDPWLLQPSNARLLNALAQHFIDSGYSLKALMREIANSDTYQLSSRYNGQWNPEWEPYFARHFVRRLWAEEIHDAVVQSSGSSPIYLSGAVVTDPGSAMQFPEPSGTPANDVNAKSFLDAFMRGNRDDQPRKQDGSILQALNLMNSPFIDQHLQTTGPVTNLLIARNLGQKDEDLVNTLFLAILSRYPSKTELNQAVSVLGLSGADRTELVQDVAWSLYNKVDFVFNY